jgi:beta-1,4-mannosyltransferase
VLQSFPQPRPTTNPYLTQLARALPPPVEVRCFSWRAALAGRYDVLHVHWPENLLRSPRRSRALARRAAVALLLVVLRARRVAVVRTVHNLEPHEPPSAVERALLGALDRATTLRVRLNAATPVTDPTRSRTIPHGHYRDWYAAQPVPASIPGRLVSIGLIRPYKGVEALTEAFTRLTDDEVPGLTLHVVGRPTTAALRDHVLSAAAGDPRITPVLDHVADDVLAAEVGQAELVVLPYTHLHNSGALLLALSLGRPVLVPAGATTAALAEEVGPGWVHTYDGPFDARVLAGALERVRSGPRAPRPDLSGRDWPAVGRLHAAAYAEAVRLRRTG